MDAEHVKGRLMARFHELTMREAALEKHLRGADGRNEQDFSDRVAFTEMDEVIEKLDDDARNEIRSIRSALNRLESGTYGSCETCGEDIAAKRLEILPHVLQCVRCAG